MLFILADTFDDDATTAQRAPSGTCHQVAIRFLAAAIRTTSAE